METTMKIAIVIICLSSLLGAGCTRGLNAQQRSQYAGQEKREIKSLSPADIEQLENGRGWGLAKAAELNGYPGPVHILEMKEKIGLTSEQTVKIKALYDGMKGRAVPLGKRLIELERKLDTSFAEESVSPESLEETVKEIGAIRAKLRLVHLATHLETPKILTTEQVDLYNKLRGYGKGDPCQNVPEGHDPEMWKKHNGCEQKAVSGEQ